ncbi:hypothetical protein [Halobacteriovorax sp. DPLXC-1]|uniref:hypothetical protein n=1 Tax=Halobacteriovorax sp. DPLXC-1 TaxID=3110771 RepID=UPI002FF367D4
MKRFLICIAFFLFQSLNVQAISDAQIKMAREIQHACQSKTNSIDRSRCQLEYRVNLVESKCGRNNDGRVEGSIVEGEIKCGVEIPSSTSNNEVSSKPRPLPRKGKCSYSTDYACEAFDFRMDRCLKSSNNNKYCKDISHKFALKAQVHEELGEDGMKAYDRCLNMDDTSPDECAKFAKFYLDEQKKSREAQSSNTECSEFAVGVRNVNCHGFEYQRVDSDLADISRHVGKSIEDSGITRREIGRDSFRSESQ